MARMVRRSLAKPGRVVPSNARHLRGRCVALRAGGVMPWHTTGAREELLIPLHGALRIEIETSGRRRRVAMTPGLTIFLPSATTHQVMNASSKPARYLYVTGGSA
jgi:quercetin dioxygenase-like cupin family protein